MGERRARAVAALSPALIMLVAAGALLIAALANDRGGEDDGPSLAELARELRPRVAAGVEEIRGLEFDHVPRARVVTAETLNRLNAEELEKPRTEARLRSEEVVAKLLGLIEFEDDVFAVARESGELAAAAYDPRDDRLYVLEDAVGASPALAEFVLAHELNHALEDQAFDIEERHGTGDEDLARSALVEGTATVVMIRYARRFQNTLALALAAGAVDSSSDDVPPFILRQLLFAYTGGAKFVRALYDETGSWLLVDRALRSEPPVSSEQIMHPRKYLLGEEPMEFPYAFITIAGEKPDPPPRGTLGEFATRQLIGEAGAAAGWGGDSWLLREPRHGTASCDEEEACRSAYGLDVSWAWDSRADAVEFNAALPDYLTGLGAERDGRRWVLPGQVVTASTAGRTTMLTFAPR